MYNITTETQSESNYKTFGGGIHSEVELQSVEFKIINNQVNNGEPTLSFNFVGPKGEKFNHLEYPAEGAKDVQKAADWMGSRVKHILTKFIPTEQVVLSGSNYSEFCNNIIALLGNNNVGKKVAIKITYGTKAYPKKRLCFPAFPDFIALESSELHLKPEDLINPFTIQPTSEEDLGMMPGETATDELGF